MPGSRRSSIVDRQIYADGTRPSSGPGHRLIGRPAAREVEDGAGREAAFLAAEPGDHGCHLVQAHEPAHGQGDLFVAALAMGRLPTGDALLATARAAGARTAVVTTAPAKVEGADLTLHLPGRTMADPPCPDLPLGGGFELALSLFFDLTVIELMGRWDSATRTSRSATPMCFERLTIYRGMAHEAAA